MVVEVVVGMVASWGGSSPFGGLFAAKLVVTIDVPGRLDMVCVLPCPLLVVLADQLPELDSELVIGSPDEGCRAHDDRVVFLVALNVDIWK